MQAVDRDELIQQVLLDIRALGTADDVMNQAAAAALGMPVTDMYAGEVLDREGPMTIGELARAVGLSAGAATALVDRLEASGLARRVPDPVNRRRILVQPTEDGTRRAYPVFAPLISRTADLLDRYRDQELLVIRDFLRGARAIITEHGEALRASRAAAKTGGGAESAELAPERGLTDPR